jgi:tetratricopeptide (TPR) repeat protein
MDLGRYRDASVSLQRAARLRPNHTEAQQHLGLACAAVEDAPCAVAALRAAGARWALAGLYGGCDVWSALGAVFLDLGLPGRAHASFLRALQVAREAGRGILF